MKGVQPQNVQYRGISGYESAKSAQKVDPPTPSMLLFLADYKNWSSNSVVCLSVLG